MRPLPDLERHRRAERHVRAAGGAAFIRANPLSTVLELTASRPTPGSGGDQDQASPIALVLALNWNDMGETFARKRSGQRVC